MSVADGDGRRGCWTRWVRARRRHLSGLAIGQTSDPDARMLSRKKERGCETGGAIEPASVRRGHTLVTVVGDVTLVTVTLLDALSQRSRFFSILLGPYAGILNVSLHAFGIFSI